MPAKDVKAYVKRNKNDAADAQAICEAVRRPTMRFVQIKSVEQQGRLMLHRARDLLMRQRTSVSATRRYVRSWEQIGSTLCTLKTTLRPATDIWRLIRRPRQRWQSGFAGWSRQAISQS